ncbi:hypothetical protein D3C81_1810380 [compost metagenome]
MRINLQTQAQAEVGLALHRIGQAYAKLVALGWVHPFQPLRKVAPRHAQHPSQGRCQLPESALLVIFPPTAAQHLLQQTVALNYLLASHLALPLQHGSCQSGSHLQPVLDG